VTYNIQSDNIGNPETEGNTTYTWKHGRQIDTLTRNGVTWTYEYNSDGLRTARTSATKDYFYVYNGDKLSQVKVVDKSVTPNVTHVMDLSYDAAGQPLTLTLDGTVYFYLLNATGDILGLLDEDGNRVIHYACEGYGKSVYFNTSPTAATLGNLDPLAYRGYVMDYGTGLYYLQSRSYNYTTGRFINADGLVSTGQGLLSNNMFTYCRNNSINLVDPTGYCSYLGSIHAPRQDCNSAYCPTSKYYAQCIGSFASSTRNVYVIKSNQQEYLNEITSQLKKNSVIVVDKRHFSDDPNYNQNIQILNSYTISNPFYRRAIIRLVLEYNKINPVEPAWIRTEDSLVVEWAAHNDGHFLAPGILFITKRDVSENTAHVDFDNKDEDLTYFDYYFK